MTWWFCWPRCDSSYLSCSSEDLKNNAGCRFWWECGVQYSLSSRRRPFRSPSLYSIISACRYCCSVNNSGGTTSWTFRILRGWGYIHAHDELLQHWWLDMRGKTDAVLFSRGCGEWTDLFGGWKTCSLQPWNNYKQSVTTSTPNGSLVLLWREKKNEQQQPPEKKTPLNILKYF